MAFRDVEIISRCDECGVATRRGCPRCARPLCREHRPRRGQRCDACEATYAAYVAQLERPTRRRELARQIYRLSRRVNVVELAQIGAGGVAGLIALLAGLGLGGAIAVAITAAIVITYASLVIGTLAAIPAREGLPGTYARRLQLEAARRAFLAERPGQRLLLLEAGDAGLNLAQLEEE